MTLSELILRAHNARTGDVSLLGNVRVLAQGIIDLLGEAAPCGWEAPTVAEFHDNTPSVHIPESWTGCDDPTPDEARALARLLLRAADEADDT